MANIVYWFKLPSQIKEKLTAVSADPLTCLDDPVINALADDITWFNLPTKLTALINACDQELSSPYSLVGTLNWFNLEKSTQDWFDHLDSLTIAACS